MIRACSIIVILTAASVAETARILALFPMPSISHQVVFRHITQELARRGHEVVVITPDPAFSKGQAPENLTEIDVHDISYKLWADTVSDFGIDDVYHQVKISFKFFSQLFETQMNDMEVKKVFTNNNNKFDLVLVESCARPTLVLSHIFKAPLIQMSSFGAMIGGEFISGAPYHPLLYPMIVRQKLYNLSFWEKLRELILEFRVLYLYRRMMTYEDKMLSRLFGPKVPSMIELARKVDMMFVNVHPIWVDNQPMPPNVIYMGGIHQNPEKKLPEDLKNYLDNSTNGVIYMSFGTNVHTSRLPKDKVQIIVKVLSRLPYNVLLKWDLEDFPERPSNVKISKYFPQSDVLRHPSIKLFITQGGLQSTDEAISAGVPLIGIPMLIDQWYNVEKYVRHKIGLRLDMVLITEDNLGNSIETVINDKSYRENILKLKSLVTDTPERPLKHAIWWIEYLLRHGGASHMRSPAAAISWTEYYEIELLFGLLATILVVIAILLFSTCYVYQYIRNHLASFKYKKS